MKKERADVLLSGQEGVESREQARRLILAGKVRVGADHVVRKASDKYPADTEFSVSENERYASRGAYKLLPALEKYLPDLSGMTAADIGASTGGFTDLMLQRGAEKVYCIDSGYGQLHGKLRADSRVLCFEKTNARHLPDDFFAEELNLITMDVSFISVTLILKGVARFLKPDGYAFILIKPQFEAERHEVGKGGVVKDSAVHEKVIEKVANFAENECGLETLEIMPSPIKGPKGNQEFLAVFRRIM